MGFGRSLYTRTGVGAGGYYGDRGNGVESWAGLKVLDGFEHFAFRVEAGKVRMMRSGEKLLEKDSEFDIGYFGTSVL